MKKHFTTTMNDPKTWVTCGLKSKSLDGKTSIEVKDEQQEGEEE